MNRSNQRVLPVSLPGDGDGCRRSVRDQRGRGDIRHATGRALRAGRPGDPDRFLDQRGSDGDEARGRPLRRIGGGRRRRGGERLRLRGAPLHHGRPANRPPALRLQPSLRPRQGREPCGDPGGADHRHHRGRHPLPGLSDRHPAPLRKAGTDRGPGRAGHDRRERDPVSLLTASGRRSRQPGGTGHRQGPPEGRRHVRGDPGRGRRRLPRARASWTLWRRD